MAKSGELAVSDLVARVEAPTMLFRVTSASTPSLVRILPFRRSGNGIYIASMCDAWAGDGSAWRRIQGADNGRAGYKARTMDAPDRG